MHYLTDPLQFEFMRRALMAIVLTGIASGVLGSYVVLRGLAFIGDALTHAVFPGIVIAVALGRSILLGALVVGLLTALGIAAISRGRRVSEDTAIGILFAAMFALGVVLVSTLAAYQRDVADLLFGQILAVSQSDLVLAGGHHGGRGGRHRAAEQGAVADRLRPRHGAGHALPGVRCSTWCCWG